jgi:hypothetical protein
MENGSEHEHFNRRDRRDDFFAARGLREKL